MAARNRYSLDKDNRLVVRRNRSKLIADGRFYVDKDNCLQFQVKEPAATRKKFGLSPKIKFCGNWSLNPDYDLELKLPLSGKNREPETLVLKGDILSPYGDTLVFFLKSIDKRGLLYLQILKLAGAWQADEANRLVFAVKKTEAPDIITFTGTWELNKNQQISYSYEKFDLKRKTRSARTFSLRGFWQINESNRLSYILSGTRHSRLDLRAQIESPTLYPARGVMRYRLGIGVGLPGATQKKVITLYGAWKLGKDLGLTFEMDYGQGGICAFEFASTVYLSKNDEFIFLLENKKREPLGVSLIFSRKFLKKLNAEALLRITKSQEETRFETGIRIPF